MRRYFEAEMRMLREAGEAYAEAYPEQARSLGLASAQDRDPYVERLLEGFAFLTAQVRQRIDAAHETTSTDVLEAVAPDLVRPYPSATIARLIPGRRQRGHRRLPAHSLLQSGEVGNPGVRCEFRSRREVDIFPLEVSELSATETPQGHTRFRIDFQYHGDEDPAALPLDAIPFFLDTDRPLALALHRLWRRSLTNATLHSADGREFDAGKIRFTAGGLEDHMAVSAGVGSMRPALRLLQDYFAFRSRFLFLSLHGLDQAGLSASDMSRFTLTFDTDRGLPRDHRLAARHLKPFCTPAVNLFPCEGRPLHFDGRDHEFEVSAESDRPGTVQVHSVHEAHARGRTSATVQPLKPLKQLLGNDHDRPFYATELREITGGAAGLWLRLGRLALDEGHTISLDLMGTQGNLPRRYLRADPLHSEHGGFTAKTLFRPSPSHLPPMHVAPSTLNALLRADLETLIDRDALVALLTAVEWTEAPENQSRIAAIESVSHQPFQRMRQGLLETGIEVTVELNEDCGFSTSDDIHLFGEVLHAFFCRIAPMNQCIATRLIAQPSGTVMAWPL